MGARFTSSANGKGKDYFTCRHKPISVLLCSSAIHYRPQRSFEGYVFTCVCLSTGESTWAGTPLGPDTPPGTRYTPWDQIHPRYQVHPPGTRYTPPGPGTPPGQVHTHPGPGTHPPSRRLLLRTVRILLECILVKSVKV